MAQKQTRPFGTTEALASGNWRARFYWPKTGPDRVRYTAPLTFPTEKLARTWLDAQKARIDLAAVTGTPWESPDDVAAKEGAEADAQAAQSAMPTVGEYMQTVIHRRATRARKPIVPTARDNYMKCFRLAIEPALGDVPLAELTRDAVWMWWDGLPTKTATQNGNAYAR